MRGNFPKLIEYENGRGDPVEAVAYEHLQELEAAFEVWDADYSEIERYHDHTGMVQLDHGHEEYEHRVRLVAALRDLFYGEPG